MVWPGTRSRYTIICLIKKSSFINVATDKFMNRSFPNLVPFDFHCIILIKIGQACWLRPPAQRADSQSTGAELQWALLYFPPLCIPTHSQNRSPRPQLMALFNLLPKLLWPSQYVLWLPPWTYHLDSHLFPTQKLALTIISQIVPLSLQLKASNFHLDPVPVISRTILSTHLAWSLHLLCTHRQISIPRGTSFFSLLIVFCSSFPSTLAPLSTRWPFSDHWTNSELPKSSAVIWIRNAL